MQALAILPSLNSILSSFSWHHLSWEVESTDIWSTLDISFKSIIANNISFFCDSSRVGFTALLNQHLSFPCDSFNHSSFCTNNNHSLYIYSLLSYKLRTRRRKLSYSCVYFVFGITFWSFLVRSACSPTSLGSSTVGHVHNELLNFHQGFLPSVLINTQYANMPLSMASITSLTFMASRFISSFSCS